MKLYTLKCPECGASVGIEEGQRSCRCPYCQCKLFFDDGKQKMTLDQKVYIHKDIIRTKRYVNDAEVIREMEKARENRRGWIANVLLFIILFGVCVLSISSYESKQKANRDAGKIHAGYYKDLIGEDYQTVEAHFRAAGFSNIELIDLNDSGILFWTDEKVKTISVGGDTDFDSGDWFEPTTKVVISYH